MSRSKSRNQEHLFHLFFSPFFPPGPRPEVKQRLDNFELPYVEDRVGVGGDKAGVVRHRLGELAGGRGRQHMTLVEPECQHQYGFCSNYVPKKIEKIVKKNTN
jgi:hypothetical protein